MLLDLPEEGHRVHVGARVELREARATGLLGHVLVFYSFRLLTFVWLPQLTHTPVFVLRVHELAPNAAPREGAQ